MKDLEKRKKKDLRDRYMIQTWYRDKKGGEGEKRSCYVPVTIYENAVTYYPGSYYKFGIVNCFEI